MSIKIIRCADSHVINVVNTSTGDILTASIVKSLIKDGKSLVHMMINTTKQGLPVFSMEHKFATMNATKVAVTCDLVDDEDLPIDIHFIVEGYQSTASYSFRNDAARSRGFNSTGAITYQDFIKEFIEDTSARNNTEKVLPPSIREYLSKD